MFAMNTYRNVSTVVGCMMERDGTDDVGNDILLTSPSLAAF